MDRGGVPIKEMIIYLAAAENGPKSDEQDENELGSRHFFTFHMAPIIGGGRLKIKPKNLSLKTHNLLTLSYLIKVLVFYIKIDRTH